MQNIPSQLIITVESYIYITSFKMKGSPDLGQAVILYCIPNTPWWGNNHLCHSEVEVWQIYVLLRHRSWIDSKCMSLRNSRVSMVALHNLKEGLNNTFCIYTLNKSSKWYIVYICKVFRIGLNADKYHHYCDFLCIIKIVNVLFVHFESSCQYQFTDKTMTSKAKWRLKPK